MILQLTRRMILETDTRILLKFLWNVGWKGRRAVAAFKRHVAEGLRSPAFLFISLTDRCNLSCQGCWVTPAEPGRQLSGEELDRIITEYKTQNKSSFFGLLGGEPLLYPELMPILAAHPDVCFQILTNGTMLTDQVAAEFRRLGNVTPLISVEGSPSISDVRRGSQNVYQRSMDAIDACRRQKLITGVATSVCKSNIHDLATESFISDLIARGVHYVWYYIYRPVGPEPTPELALDEEDILNLRRFLVDARCRFPIVIIDAYWDADGKALCPAVEGMSHHIGPGGDIEPCPPLQFSTDNIRDGKSLNSLFQNSAFLEEFRRTAADAGRGCILLESPETLHEFLNSAAPRDTTGRGTGLQEIAAMRKRPGHNLPGREIPEKHWLYRVAKKHWFFGFGTYG